MKDTNEIILKNKKEIGLMTEAGKKLGKVKGLLIGAIKEGGNAQDLNEFAERLIKKEKAECSFKMVPGYKWAICVNKNSGVVHGIPKRSVVFKKGDIVSVDLGLFYKGFHSDTSFSLAIGSNKDIKKFLDVGREALKKAIKQARPGKRIYDISESIEKTVKKKGYSPIRALVGHGIGRSLHEGPQIPCFTMGKKELSPQIKEGLVIAIEVMYSLGSGDIELSEDGWTISTSDDTISALFEDTVAITKTGPKILTGTNIAN